MEWRWGTLGEVKQTTGCSPTQPTMGSAFMAGLEGVGLWCREQCARQPCASVPCPVLPLGQPWTGRCSHRGEGSWVLSTPSEPVGLHPLAVMHLESGAEAGGRRPPSLPRAARPP